MFAGVHIKIGDIILNNKMLIQTIQYLNKQDYQNIQVEIIDNDGEIFDEFVMDDTDEDISYIYNQLLEISCYNSDNFIVRMYLKDKII